MAVAAAVLAADQLSKAWAVEALDRHPIALLGPVRLALTRNRAAAFGLGGDLVPFLAIAVLGLVVLAATRGRATTRRAMAVGVGLVVGGAFGNLADRAFRSPGLLRGAVVDFIDLRWWPVFNLADTAITFGCVVLLLASRRAS